MAKTAYILITILLLATATAAGVYYISKPKPATPVACTMEARLCPDGSAVGRTGPKCEFAPCPIAAATGIIKGKVSVGPICPVERVDVPCPVPPEAYISREVILYGADGTTEIKRMNFAPDGTYQFAVPAGVYVLDTPKAGIGGSSNLPQTLTVKAGETLVVDFAIDTGIR